MLFTHSSNKLVRSEKRNLDYSHVTANISLENTNSKEDKKKTVLLFHTPLVKFVPSQATLTRLFEEVGRQRHNFCFLVKFG